MRFSNPTGHYELNLCSKVHQALATRLKDVAYRWGWGSGWGGGGCWGVADRWGWGSGWGWGWCWGVIVVRVHTSPPLRRAGSRMEARKGVGAGAGVGATGGWALPAILRKRLCFGCTLVTCTGIICSCVHTQVTFRFLSANPATIRRTQCTARAAHTCRTPCTPCTYTVHPYPTLPLHLSTPNPPTPPTPSEPVDSTNWLNIVHDMYSSVSKVTGNFGPPEAWHGLVPNSGTLSFDFVSSQVGGGGGGAETKF